MNIRLSIKDLWLFTIDLFPLWLQLLFRCRRTFFVFVTLFWVRRHILMAAFHTRSLPQSPWWPSSNRFILTLTLIKQEVVMISSNFFLLCWLRFFNSCCTLLLIYFLLFRFSFHCFLQLSFVVIALSLRNESELLRHQGFSPLRLAYFSVEIISNCTCFGLSLESKLRYHLLHSFWCPYTLAWVKVVMPRPLHIFVVFLKSFVYLLRGEHIQSLCLAPFPFFPQIHHY